jgi:hypothetical protein
VNAHYATTIPYLGAFTGLQKLRISGIDEGCDGLDIVIANNPGLSHLDIEATLPNNDLPKVYPPPDIFALVSPQVINLRSLGLSRVEFMMQDGSGIVPHLQSLESLRLQDYSWTTRGIDWSGNPNPNPLAYRIWILLGNSGVNLRHIDVDMVDDTLLDYLSSSSGLETLRISFSYDSTDALSTALACRLFTSALPRHAKSLRSLFLLVPPGNALCAHAEYCKSLVVCKALVDLSLSIAVHSEKQVTDIVSLKCAIIF